MASLALRFRQIAKLVLSALLVLTISTQQAAAQSILRDAETEAFLTELSLPLIRAAKLDPRSIRFALVGDRSINAAADNTQTVYINSGLIVKADNANELEGVIAHELGHIAGGHVTIRSAEGVKDATRISILSLLLGAAAIAAGAGEAGVGILGAGQQAAVNKFLAFSRSVEATADASAQNYLSATGKSGRGMISFFKKLQNLEFRYGAGIDDDSFGGDHPLTGDRIAILQDKFEADPAWNAKTDPAIEARFQRIKAKLQGYVNEPQQTLRDYPESDNSIPAHYARAYAWHRSAYPDKALQEADALLAAIPGDPYFLELKGQILLESGKPSEALPLLRQAVAKTNAQPLIASLFGHALIATEDSANFAEAEKVLKASITKDNENPFAWYQLGVVYDREGDTGRAAMATAERYHLEGQPRLALTNAEMAVRTLPQGSPDWIRAQDIALVSRSAVDDEKRKRR